MKEKGPRKIVGIVTVVGLFLTLFRPDSIQMPAVNSPISAFQAQAASMLFIENIGQFPDYVRFQVIGPKGTLWLADDAVWLMRTEPDPEGAETQDSVLPRQDERGYPSAKAGGYLKLTFIAASPHLRLVPFDRQDVRVSYLLGSDPSQWLSSVPVWGGVRYTDLYPGIDLVLNSTEDGWSWRLICSGGACQPGLPDIRLRMEGIDSLEILANTMKIAQFLTSESPLPLGADSILHPFLGVNEALHRLSQPSQFFSTPQKDSASNLLYSTFLGGNNADYGNDIAVDDSGTAYIAGRTESNNFPTTTGAMDTTYNSIDSFVVKVAPDGSLVYATFLGGSVTDEATSIAIDDSGAAFVTGYTYSTNFPTTPGAFDTTYNGSVDVFVVKLTPDGSALSYGTFLGGSGMTDRGMGIALDNSGAAYIHGYTSSTDFPTTLGALDTTHNGYWDAFIVKLAPDGNSLAYSTFLGGSDMETGVSITVDGSGAVYVSGSSASTNFPTTAGAFDTNHNGLLDVYVGKLAPDGNSLVYSTFLGGSADDQPGKIAVDSNGAAYLTGATDSSNFPTTPGTIDTSHNGDRDAFVCKLAPDGSLLAYSTFLGGSGSDNGRGLAVAGSGAAYIVGGTTSAGFPVTPDGYDTSYNGDNDIFMLKVTADGSSLAYGSFLGGRNSDYAYRLAVDNTGIAYITGRTESSTFPTTPGAYDQTFGGSICGVSPLYPCPDAFLAKVAIESPTPPKNYLYLPLVIR